MKNEDRRQACAGGGLTPVVGLGGENGSQLIANTTALTKDMIAIEVWDDTVFEILEGNNAGIVGETVPAGKTIFGLFSKVKLTSGRVLVYFS